MRDVCGNDRPQLFILLEGGAKFHVGVGLSERVGKVAGGLEDLFQLRTMSTVTAWKGVFAPDGNTRAFRDQPVLDPSFPSDSANGAQTFFS